MERPLADIPHRMHASLEPVRTISRDALKNNYAQSVFGSSCLQCTRRDHAGLVV